MFDLRKFWLTTTAYVLIPGIVIVGAGVGFHALVGMPTKETSRQSVTATEPIKESTGRGMPAEIRREPPAPASPAPTPQSSYVQRASPARSAAAATPSRVAVPEIQIIVPERKSTKGSSRSGY